MIAEPYEHMPAATVGLKAGDILMEIDARTLQERIIRRLARCFAGR